MKSMNILKQANTLTMIKCHALTLTCHSLGHQSQFLELGTVTLLSSKHLVHIDSGMQG